ncbi:MAG: aminopeptidase P family protein [Chloroflexi bacterium]|nr:aminopeptidase P family protein [Chloroflexota bacterium]
MKERLAHLREQLKEVGLDAILISDDTNRRYFSGFHGTAGFLLVSQKQAILATDFRYTEQARHQAPDFEVLEVEGGLSQWFPKAAKDLGRARLGFEADHMTLASYRQWTNAVGQMEPKLRPELVSTEGIGLSLRSIKDLEEISYLEQAAALADSAISYARTLLRPGMKEWELAWELEQHLRRRGSESLPFPIIVAAGPNAASPHHHPGDDIIMPGQPVVVDLGARVSGYCSDITRTFCLEPISVDYRRIYDIVLRAQLAAISGLRTGMTGGAVDGLARNAIEATGYGKDFGHGLGHGVGLEEHELPRLGRGSSHTLDEGMVFTIEPGIYLNGWGGVRIEDMVALTGGKPHLLTKAAK